MKTHQKQAVCLTDRCTNETTHDSGYCRTCRTKREDPNKRSAMVAAITDFLISQGFTQIRTTNYLRTRYQRDRVLVTLNAQTIYLATKDGELITQTQWYDLLDVSLAFLQQRIIDKLGICF